MEKYEDSLVQGGLLQKQISHYTGMRLICYTTSDRQRI